MGAPFGITYAEIKAMVRQWALQTQNARAIMRKSGFRNSSSANLPPVPILSLEGSKRACFAPDKPFCGYEAHFAVSDSRLYAWGINDNNLMAEDPYVHDYFATPSPIGPGLSGIVDAAIGSQASALVLGDGTAYISDRPDNPTNTSHPFAQLTTLSGVIQCDTDELINAGALYFLLSDGTVWGMGERMPGTGPSVTDWTTDISTPQQMPTAKVSDVVEIKAYHNNLAFRRSDDSVIVWEYDTADPVEIGPSVIPDPIDRMASGLATLYALTTAGDIYATGSNAVGQYGNSTASSTVSLDWHQTDGTGYTDVGGAQSEGFAIKDGDLYSWGESGAITARGLSGAEVHTPTLVTLGPSGGSWLSLATHHFATSVMAVYSTGCTYIWGKQFAAEFGQGYVGERFLGEPTPVLISVPIAPLPV